MFQKTLFIRVIRFFVISGMATTGIFAQPKSMTFSMKTIDFGNIATVMFPAKTVEFTNMAKEKLAILVVEKGPDVKVGYQHRFFEPGEKGMISLFYETEKLGPFHEEIRIFTNLDDDPYILALKGNCITIEECFPDRANMTLRNVFVIDKQTQAPVPYASVSFIHNFTTGSPILCKTDQNGKAIKALPIGQYNAKSVAAGYLPFNLDFFLPRSQPNILIELDPVKPETAIAQVELPQKNDEEKEKPSAEINVPVTSTILPEDKYAANNIVLLLDVSSSMIYNSKFTLLQQTVNNLVMVLRPIDNVSIITYARDANIVLNGVPGSEKEKISRTVQELTASGITQGVKGLNTAYDLALEEFIAGGNNQIILATDGEFSEKNVTDEFYRQLITGYAAKGIKLSILGFGVNEKAIDRMKKMSAFGEGSYIHIGSEKYIKDVLINEVKAMSFMGRE